LPANRKVWKYTIPVTGVPHGIQVPIGARPVHVAAGNRPDEVLMWVEVDADSPDVHRVFQVFGTGHPIPEGWEYVGTAPTPFALVWHLYERTP
jgi:hypothetical protein